MVHGDAKPLHATGHGMMDQDGDGLGFDEIQKGGPSQLEEPTLGKRFVSRKKLILIVVAVMVVVTALALGLGLGLGLTRGCSACATGDSSAPTATTTPTPSATSNSSTGSNVIQPTVGETWDYPLGFSLTPSNVNKSIAFYPVDWENTDADTISLLKSAGHTIVCYFSAGSVESYRSDADQFPASAVGNTLQGWDDENWVDTRDKTVRKIMAARIQTSKDKGCVGVDADNIDGYENDSGFPLTEDTAVDYITYLADTANGLGLAYGLKNGGDLVDRVVDKCAWAINEQCAEYSECADWAPFVKAGKPVFHVEYTESETATSVSASELKKACDADGQTGFSSIVKHLSLDNWIVTCG
ncbi:glycoside hydrolase superfamily [Xylariaceae sp. FL0255]|nr:glycoside hydrolase superfamily [Xylariaceae sp. FL0255]